MERAEVQGLVYLLAIGSALAYGSEDFLGGLTARRASALPVVVVSRLGGLAMVALLLSWLPHAAAGRTDMLWGASTGLTSGVGVALLYRALAIAGGLLDVLAHALYLFAARYGPLSIVVTLSSLYPVSTVLLARAVLRERLNGWQIGGMCCALAAIVLIVRGAR